MTRSLFRVATTVTTAILLSLPSTLAAQDRFPDPQREGGWYSDAVRVGDLVFLAGVVAGGETPADQFHSIWQRIGRILDEAGSSLEQIVDITTYHVDMHSHIDDFIAVKDEYLPNLPTWTAIGVTELYSSNAIVEVKVIAAVNPDSD